MKQKFSKFIMENGRLVIGKVTFHYELRSEGESEVTGGGWFHYDSNDKSFLLYSSSHDFGRFREEEVVEAIKNGWCDERHRPGRHKDKNFRVSTENFIEEALKNNYLVEK